LDSLFGILFLEEIRKERMKVLNMEELSRKGCSKMIRLVFMGTQRRIIRFHIDNRKIVYFDDNWKNGIQIMPKNEELIKKLIDSGRHNLRMMAALILDSNKDKSLEEYNSCKTDEELEKMVEKDCRLKGLVRIDKGRCDL